MINIVLPRQQIETVDAKTFDAMTILDEDALNSVQSLLPVTIDHVQFGFFEQGRSEVLVLNGDFGQSLQGKVILLVLLKETRSTKH